MPIESAAIPDRDSLHVPDIAWTRGEKLHYDQVFGRASSKFNTVEVEGGRSLNHFLLKWKRAERNIDACPFRRIEQQNTPRNGERSRVGNTGPIMRKQGIDDLILAAKSCQDIKIHITCDAWPAPTIHRGAVDDARAPSLKSGNCFAILNSLFIAGAWRTTLAFPQAPRLAPGEHCGRHS